MVVTLMVGGQFPTETDNLIEDPNQILDNALFALNDTAMKFAKDVINDAKVRESYISNIKRMSVKLKD